MHTDRLGYLEIDHRASPGTAAVPEGTVGKWDYALCGHCQRGVRLNPGRVRARATCLKCMSYICDGCEDARVASGGACVPFIQQLDRAQTILERYADQPDHPLAVLDPVALAQPGPPRIVLT